MGPYYLDGDDRGISRELLEHSSNTAESYVAVPLHKVTGRGMLSKKLSGTTYNPLHRG